ncbi:hypothetical protein Tco_0424785 [Tanacetum coccineum]
MIGRRMSIRAKCRLRLTNDWNNHNKVFSNDVLESIEGLKNEKKCKDKAQDDRERQIKMIQVKEMMQDKDLKNSKSKDKGSRSRSRGMNEQSQYKQDKTKRRRSSNVISLTLGRSKKTSTLSEIAEVFEDFSHSDLGNKSLPISFLGSGLMSLLHSGLPLLSSSGLAE